MTAREIGEVAGVKVSIDATKGNFKKALGSLADKKIDDYAFESVRFATKELMEFFTPDARVVERWRETIKAGSERVSPADAVLSASGFADAAKEGGVLVLGGANAPNVGKTMAVLGKIEEAKNVGLMISDIALLGIAWKSVEIDDKVALAEKEREIYMNNLKGAAEVSFSIMHGKRPLPMAKAMEHARTAFPDVQPEHLTALVRKMESEHAKATANTQAPSIDVMAFRQRRGEAMCDDAAPAATARSSGPSV